VCSVTVNRALRAAGYRASDLVRWHDDFLRCSDSVSFQGQLRRAPRVSRTPALDPEPSALGKLAKDRRCKSSTG